MGNAQKIFHFPVWSTFRIARKSPTSSPPPPPTPLHPPTQKVISVWMKSYSHLGMQSSGAHQSPQPTSTAGCHLILLFFNKLRRPYQSLETPGTLLVKYRTQSASNYCISVPVVSRSSMQWSMMKSSHTRDTCLWWLWVNRACSSIIKTCCCCSAYWK